jgi:hypothetical protein
MMQRAVICLGLLLSLTTACASQSSETLVFTMEQALATSPGGADLTRVVPGEWDRVCIFRPHTTYARVDSVLGSQWEASRQTGVEASGDAALVAFVRGTTVIDHIMYPVAKGDFGTPGPEQWYCLPRERAVLELRQPIDGRIPWIGPAVRR